MILSALVVGLAACSGGAARALPPPTVLAALPTAAPASPQPPAAGTTPGYPAPGQTPVIATATQSSYPAPAAGTETPVSTATNAATPSSTTPFDAQRSNQDLLYQMSLGPRTPGSQAHTQVIAWMKSELAKSGWTVEDQVTSLNGQPIHNVIAKRGSGSPWTIIGAHFDSRFKADRDPDPAKRSQPVPGADDGASGVAVLIELSRILPKDTKGQVWLAFIDSEDQGDLNLPGWDWTLGSRALADSLSGKPNAVIILDMIGDANLNILEERNSNPELTKQIWDTAAKLGYSQSFIPQPGYAMLDDHTPFLQKGMPAVDIIDFDYPYWHLEADHHLEVGERHG